MAGERPDVLWLVAGNDELAAPPATESMLAVAGAPGVGEFTFAAIEPIALPATLDVTTSTGEVTAVAWRCEPCSHGMIELQSGTSGYEDPLEPPLVERAVDLSFENPIVEIHQRITRLLVDVAAGRRVTVD